MLPERKTPWKNTRRPMLTVTERLNDIVARNPEDFEPYPQPKPTRQPIQPGRYGVVYAGQTTPYEKRVIHMKHGAYTADELREAAHLFNQIAETLEDAARI